MWLFVFFKQKTPYEMRISDWSSDVCSSDLGQVGVHGDGSDLAIVSYGNGYYLSRQAEKILADDGVKARVIDLRWLGPVDEDALLAAVGGAQRILIVDECRITGSQSEALMALFTQRAPDKTHARISAADRQSTRHNSSSHSHYNNAV